MKKFYLSSILVIAMVFTPHLASATGYGGYVTFTVPCTCSGGLMAFFSPLYLSSKVPIFGSLYVPLTSRAYKHFLKAVPTTWEVGNFVPGGVCLVLAPIPVDPCIPIPTLGTVRFMGTSFAGARP